MIKSIHINLNLLDLLTPSSVSKKSKCNLTTRDFQTYFKSVNYPESIFDQPDDDGLYFNDRYLNGELDIMFTELNLPFTTEELFKACKNLNIGKSAGSDYLLNDFFFKYGSCCNTFINVLSCLFNKRFDLRYFPTDWTDCTTA